MAHIGRDTSQDVARRHGKLAIRSPSQVEEGLCQAVRRLRGTGPDGLSRHDLVAGCAGRCRESYRGRCTGLRGVPRGFADLVVTSPPYPNNYDYADATRLEMCFLREIEGWGDLRDAVRRHLVVSCSQHVPEKSVDLAAVLNTQELSPIRAEIADICDKLGKIRMTKGGKKTYHLMIACYFADLAKVWHALRQACDSPSQVCFVIGDSAPYGVYVPVMDWMGRLALDAGFSECHFEKLRDRNLKWKNRKHRVPLSEGRLWVKG